MNVHPRTETEGRIEWSAILSTMHPGPSLKPPLRTVDHGRLVNTGEGDIVCAECGAWVFDEMPVCPACGRAREDSHAS